MILPRPRPRSSIAAPCSTRRMRALTYQGQRIELTKNDYRILQTLLERKGSVVSRETLMEKLWETDSFVDENTLTVNIARLRRKLEAAGLPDYITTKKASAISSSEGARYVWCLCAGKPQGRDRARGLHGRVRARVLALPTAAGRGEVCGARVPVFAAGLVRGRLPALCRAPAPAAAAGARRSRSAPSSCPSRTARSRRSIRRSYARSMPTAVRR